MLIVEANVEDFYDKYKNLKKEHVKCLQEWLIKQPHLPKFKGTYFFILITTTNNVIN